MKIPYKFIALCLSLFGVSAIQAQTIVLAFDNPAAFTDLSLQGMSAERTLPIFEQEVSRELNRLAERSLQEGETLRITFKDIDMAGEIQPWRNRNNANIRYMENIFPPRLWITYQLLDAENNILQEGEARLTDMAFLMRVDPVGRTLNFSHEIQLLRDWLRRTSFREG